MSAWSFNFFVHAISTSSHLPHCMPSPSLCPPCSSSTQPSPSLPHGHAPMPVRPPPLCRVEGCLAHPCVRCRLSHHPRYLPVRPAAHLVCEPYVSLTRGVSQAPSACLPLSGALPAPHGLPVSPMPPPHHLHTTLHDPAPLLPHLAAPRPPMHASGMHSPSMHTNDDTALGPDAACPLHHGSVDCLATHPLAPSSMAMPPAPLALMSRLSLAPPTLVAPCRPCPTQCHWPFRRLCPSRCLCPSRHLCPSRPAMGSMNPQWKTLIRSGK